MTTRILNVDDDEAGRYVTSRHLRHAGFDVIEAARGLDAIELARSARPDLLLLDVNLPDISGHEVCAVLRSDSEFSNLPVLMLSASFISGSDRVRGLTGGADAYLAEPVEASELIAVINALLRLRRAEKDVLELNRALKAKVLELETTLDTLPIGLAIANDPDCADVRRNAALAMMTGVPASPGPSHDENGALPFEVRTAGATVALHELPLQRAARGEIVRDQEHEIVRGDGSSIFVYAHASPLYDADGKLSGSVAAFVDVTDRKLSEARQGVLADMTELLAEGLDIEKILHGTAKVAARHVADWCVIDAQSPSGELQRVAVAHRDPALRETAADFCRQCGPDRIRSAAMYRAFETGRPELVREVPTHTIAAFRDVACGDLVERLGLKSYICVPLVARGRSLGVMTLIRGSGAAYENADLTVITELAGRAALALDNAYLFRAAEEANRAKDVFFAMVSHELRTPLTAIMGWSMMLNEHDVDPAMQRTGLSEIHRSAKSQARLIDDLLDTARIAAGKIHLELSRVSLDDVLDEAVSLVQQGILDKSIHLTSERQPSAVVSGDRQRLIQIASNLLTNAVKFTPPNGTIETIVWIDEGRSFAGFSIRDNGQGIAPDFLPHIFDRFSQQQESTSPVGLGLGLNIAKSFAEMHGGDLTVSSEGEGKGAVFTVKLPLLG
jgi:signal transduction histidine kinase/CheY-like chemotaxis protein